MSEDERNDDQDALGDDWEAALAEQQSEDDGAEAESGKAGAGRERPASGAAERGAQGNGGDRDGARGNGRDRRGADAEPADLDDLEPEGRAPADEDVNLDVILDIPVTLSMEIGRTRINIRNLLQLNQGSVVELDRLAGEPMDVLVNGTLVAHGEVVVVNERFGIRLTDVVSPSERVKKLR
ncbi:flagellar motor switch protein FliN [Sediminicurvatus halobius]|uniref:Flagellar motor switch protein FliN n=1 Tax=Sediminicurvatus halobius TaxID=2182432 RepID=A0A2U2N368_9GAMM|nr:flagellar motor switch protein FliN [Spiribacter halobius]PWG63655.1 flagellar motor switch protein FliN [Spiribacter halobius]UEX79793.1 flagellar motor switch protein FliN [Spiribacter halobius]